MLPMFCVNAFYILQVVYKVMFSYNKYFVFVFAYHTKPHEYFGYLFLGDIGAIK